MQSMTVERLTAATARDAERISLLLEQLGTKDGCPLGRLLQVVAEERNMLLVVRSENGTIDGMLTLVRDTLTSGDKYRIEDVVVDNACRGRGIGRALVAEALRLAASQTPHAKIFLTSNPLRTAARALYLSMGFGEYDTGVFRIEL